MQKLIEVKEMENSALEVKQSKMKRSKNRRIKTPLFYYIMLALPLLQFLTFYVVVNFNSFLLIFKDTTGGRLDKPTDPLFKNFSLVFVDLFGKAEGSIFDSIIFKAVGKSLIFCALSIIVVMPLSLIFAYYIDKRFKGHKFFKVMLFLPGMITSMILVIIFKYFNDTALPGLLDLIGVDYGYTISSTGDTRSNFLLMTAFYLMFAFSGSILLYLNAMSKVDKSALEAARIDGAGELRTFFSIVIPGIWPTIVSFITINIAAIGTFQANMYSFYQSSAGANLQTFGYYIFNTIFLNGGSMTNPVGFGKAATAGIMATLIIAPITVLVRYLLTRFGPREE